MSLTHIRQYLSDNLPKSKVEDLIQEMRNNRIEDRVIKYDLNGGNTPPWRRLMWSKVISVALYGEEINLDLIEREAFPDPYLKRNSEPVDHELNDIAS